MEEVILKDPYPYGIEKIDDIAQAYLDILGEIQALHEAGLPIYVKATKGDRKGTIAKFVPYADGIAASSYRARIWPGNGQGQTNGFRTKGTSWGTLRWDGRRNKVRATIPHGFVWLRGYDGPTVWAKFDAKAAKEALLKNPDQLDIDGKLLTEGDEVLYIKVRFGSGMELQHGYISRFEAKVDSHGSEIFTVVGRDVDDEESKIRNSDNMIYKKG